MGLSKQWTAIQAYTHAASIFGDMDPVAYAQRFEILNLAQFSVLANFYGLMSAAYMTPVTFSVDQTCAAATAGNAGFTAATQLLTATSITFASTDAGKTVIMRKGTNGWVGFVLAVTGVNTAVLYGPQLPTTDQAALDEFIMLNTAITSSVIDISTLPIMRAGGPQIKWELESSATQFLDVVSAEKFRTFRPSDPGNANRIVWYVSGNYMYLKWGTGLGTTAGTLTLRYPRVPIAMAADGDSPDIPDGAPIQLFLTLIKRTLDNRFIKSKANYTAEITEGVETTMRAFGMVAKEEEIENKVKTLAA